MQAILDFFTGTLNTVAWMYILLPCVAVGGIFFTILGWSLYGTRCVEQLFGMKITKVYQLIFVIMIVVGATTSLDVAWDLADTFNGLMAIPNFIALFALSGVVARLTKEYFAPNNRLQ